jgi:ribA/ribD-fused uncharacterized protein
MSKIEVFDGVYHFLSNFFLIAVEYEGITYCCSECAFQAAKTLNMKDRERFISMAPGKAKREGRKLKLRENWDAIKDTVMLEIVRAKFRQNPELAERLIATGDAELIEGNYWGDDYWGVCHVELGKNKLGKILMQVRSELKDAGSAREDCSHTRI